MIEIAPSILSADFSCLGEQIMIVEPGRYAEQFVQAGAKMVSIHIEADPHAHRTLSSIRAAGAQAGIAVNPATPLSALDEALKFADYVLLMSVNPGFGGQKFIPESLDKVRRLRKMLDERGLKTRIEIDGGVDSEKIAEVASAGAEIIVSGSAIFGAPDPAVALRKLREATVLWV